MSAEANRKSPEVWYVAAGYGLPGGIEAYLYHYATTMRRFGFSTRVCVFHPLPAQRHRYLDALAESGVSIESLETEARGEALLRAFGLWLPWFVRSRFRGGPKPSSAAFFRWLVRRCSVARLARRIRREQPAVIHVKGRLPTEAWRVLPSERAIYHVATDGRRDPSWDEAEVEEFRGFLSRAARIFAPGTMVAENLKRDFGVRRPVDVIFTMAPDETGSRPGGPRYRAPSDFGPVRFGILCRFSDEKGIPHILEALSRYRERHGDVHFTFAGDGERRGLIEEYVAQRDLPHVRIVPVRSPIEALDPIDVFVHPSLSEAMPVSIVEALMCGRPCIGTRVGGIPDLIRDGVEGFLIQPGSAPAILDAMERFNVMVGEERLAFQKRARARYENVCRPEKVGQVLAEHYRQIMTGGGGR